MDPKHDDERSFTVEELRRREEIDAEVAASAEPEVYRDLLEAVEVLLKTDYGAVTFERLVREWKVEVGDGFNENITGFTDHAWERGWLRAFDASDRLQGCLATLYVPGWWSDERVRHEVPQYAANNEEKPERR
jgi:hypothetical protein